MSPSEPSNPDKDVISEASFKGSDGDSDYVNSAKKLTHKLNQHAGLQGTHQKTVNNV